MNSSFAYGSTLLLGALHALEPGHGKSFIAAYLVGEKFTARHIFTLGFALLLSHFLLLTAIALLMRFIFPEDQAEHLQEVLSWIGPLLIFGFGCYLLMKKHSHHHAGEETVCHEPPAELKETSSLKKTAMVGAIGGLLPCPTVIAPILLSGAINDFYNAIFYILIYILGMGVVLMLMIILFLMLKNAVVKKLNRLASKINPHFVSAVLITAVGLIYLLMKIFSNHTHA